MAGWLRENPIKMCNIIIINYTCIVLLHEKIVIIQSYSSEYYEKHDTYMYNNTVIKIVDNYVCHS